MRRAMTGFSGGGKSPRAVLIEQRPPKIAFLYLAAAFVFCWIVPGGRLVQWRFYWGGVLFFAAGFGFMLWSWALFRYRGTSILPAEKPKLLVTDGPYACTRNPMYLGLTLLLAGIAFLAGWIPFYIVPVAFWFTMNQVFIPHEEKKLAKRFGPAYLSYCSRVRRWL